jgi:hypothetical protein
MYIVFSKNSYIRSKNQKPRPKGTGYVVLVRYMSQGKYPNKRLKERGMYPLHTINIIEKTLDRKDLLL